MSRCVLVSRFMSLHMVNVLLLKSHKEDYVRLQEFGQVITLVTSTDVMTLAQPSVLDL